MLNKVTFIGNLGRDPEVRRLESGIAVAKFSLATNENYKDKNGEWQKNTEWHDVVCWRSLADRAESQLKKGSLVYLEGKLTHRKYQDKDGNDKYITEVVAAMFRSLERRENTSGSYSSPMPTAENAPPQVMSSGGQNPNPVSNTPNVVESADDDLPF